VTGTAGGSEQSGEGTRPRLDLANARYWGQKWRWYERSSLPWNRVRIHREFARRRAFARWPVHGNVLESLLDGRLELGSDVLLEPDVWITMPTPARVRIGAGTFLNLGVMVAALELVEIGAHCMFANGCLITDANHRFDDLERPITWQGFTSRGPTRIGDNVWCGAHVVVTSGVTIGERCVIGANSVVTADIPPFSIAAGSPARVLRTIGDGGGRAHSGPERREHAVRRRAPEPSDLEAVHAVLAARDVTDLGVEDFKLEDLRDEWSQGEFDLAADARVAEGRAGAIVGWAETRRQGGFAAVAPDAEGQGHGTALLAWLEGRERETGRDVHRQLIASTNLTGEHLLRDAGYALVRSNYRLARRLAGPNPRPDPAPAPPLTAPPTAPTTPPPTAPTTPNVTLRRLDVERDAAAIHELDAAAFAGQPGAEPQDYDAFVADHLRVHDLDADLSRVAERDGQIIGFLLARRREPEGIGHIDLLAVDPEAQGAGVGSALLAGATDAFAQAGLQTAELMVSSENQRARSLYERHGLLELHRFDIYEKPVTSS
jgi:acetyltransferase-like isoleucine patch superfamily enzyme/ribosomal protein S18 acetylase RimI-like enzyme